MRPKILITIEGGNVQSIVASEDMDVVIADYDNIWEGVYGGENEKEYEGVNVTVPDVIQQSFRDSFDTTKMTNAELIVYNTLKLHNL